MSPSESDLALLETARRCDFYGVKFHPARVRFLSPLEGDGGEDEEGCRTSRGRR